MSETQHKPITFRVEDELCNLRQPLPIAGSERARYALGFEAMPSIETVFQRRQEYMPLAERVASASTACGPSVHALAEIAARILPLASRIALGLLPPRTSIDGAIKGALTGQVRALLAKNPSGDARLNPQLQAFDLSDIASLAPLPEPSGVRLKGVSWLSPTAAPGLPPSALDREHIHELARFASARPDPEGLIDQAIEELARSDRWRTQLPALNADAIEEAQRAADCARLRGYSALACVGVWSGCTRPDVRFTTHALEIARFRTFEPVKFRAAVELAIQDGQAIP